MRERYVLQVLLVTAGFGLLLGVFAVVATPDDQSQPPPVCDIIAKPDEAAVRVADFHDECSLPFLLGAEEPEHPAKQDCEKTNSSLRGLRSE